MGSRAEAIERIGVLKERGLSVVSINCALRVCNAFWKSSGQDIKIPKLKEETRIITTLSTDHITALLRFRAVGTNLQRAHVVALTILDTGLRASELLGLAKEDIDFDNLVIKVLGKVASSGLYPFRLNFANNSFVSP